MTNPKQSQAHAHRWRIAEPDGPESAGVCVTCGAERVFSNRGPELTRETVYREYWRVSQ